MMNSPRTTKNGFPDSISMLVMAEPANDWPWIARTDAGRQIDVNAVQPLKAFS
jgi:hypothetical protein